MPVVAANAGCVTTPKTGIWKTGYYRLQGCPELRPGSNADAPAALP
jgi:hypothetical protein